MMNNLFEFEDASALKNESWMKLTKIYRQSELNGKII